MLKIPLLSIHGLERRVPNGSIGLPRGLRLCEKYKQESEDRLSKAERDRKMRALLW